MDYTSVLYTRPTSYVERALNIDIFGFADFRLKTDVACISWTGAAAKEDQRRRRLLDPGTGPRPGPQRLRTLMLIFLGLVVVIRFSMY